MIKMIFSFLFEQHFRLIIEVCLFILDIMGSHESRTWMEHLLKGFKWWSPYDRSGGTIICVQESVALATHCTSALLNSDGRIASVVLRGRDTNLLLIGTYWPSGHSEDAHGMQKRNAITD